MELVLEYIRAFFIELIVLLEEMAPYLLISSDLIGDEKIKDAVEGLGYIYKGTIE